MKTGFLVIFHQKVKTTVAVVEWNRGDVDAIQAWTPSGPRKKTSNLAYVTLGIEATNLFSKKIKENTFCPTPTYSPFKKISADYDC